MNEDLTNLIQWVKKYEYDLLSYKSSSNHPTIKYLNHSYSAKEAKSLCKFIGKFESIYINYVISHVSPTSIYTHQHIKYLKAQGKK